MKTKSVDVNNKNYIFKSSALTSGQNRYLHFYTEILNDCYWIFKIIASTSLGALLIAIAYKYLIGRTWLEVIEWIIPISFIYMLVQLYQSKNSINKTLKTIKQVINQGNCDEVKISIAKAQVLREAGDHVESHLLELKNGEAILLTNMAMNTTIRKDFVLKFFGKDERLTFLKKYCGEEVIPKLLEVEVNEIDQSELYKFTNVNSLNFRRVSLNEIKRHNGTRIISADGFL